MPFVSKDKFPVANAIVNMGRQFGGAATPWIAGILRDNPGRDYVLEFMSAISCLTFIVVLILSEPMKARGR